MNEWRVLTWNVQGADGLDIDFVRAHIFAQRADIVVIQEIHHRQAKRLGLSLAMAHRWARKHMPFPGLSEGLAIYARHPITDFAVQIVTAAAPWSWRRRILVRATIAPASGAVPLRVMNVHLSPHGAAHRRALELTQINQIDEVHPVDVIAGDFNEALTITSPMFVRHRDTGPNGPPTCWPPGARRGRAPTQRLDGVFMADGWTAHASHTPTADFDRWAAVSDHLPVAVTIRREPTPD